MSLHIATRLVACVLLLAGLTACGHTNTRIKQGMDKPLRELSGYDSSYPLVTIRYPVSIDPKHAEAIRLLAYES